MSNAEISNHLNEGSPFHEGERAVQQKAGALEKMDNVGRKVIRDFMPDQHREFFEKLPFVLVGSTDADGQPWASILAGPAGFVSAPDPRQLAVTARPLFADPLGETLALNVRIGLLGIEPHTRRRNRMNGTVTHLTDEKFHVRVNQSYGNCPKYIQAREPYVLNDASGAGAPAVHRAARLDTAMCRLIESADTFFIATAYAGKQTDHGPQFGADVSHRGGKPGFVRVNDAKTLTVPDFIGNFLFNTLGNLVMNPRAGLLFIDFTNGDLLYLAVDAAIIWDGAEVDVFAGAERLLQFNVRQAILVEASLPLRWDNAELSPALERTGSWAA